MYGQEQLMAILIPVLFVFLIGISIIWLVRMYLLGDKLGRRASRLLDNPELAEEEPSVGNYFLIFFGGVIRIIVFILSLVFIKIPLFIYRLCSRKPADSSRMPREYLHDEDKEKESDKGMDEYHV